MSLKLISFGFDQMIHSVNHSSRRLLSFVMTAVLFIGWSSRTGFSAQAGELFEFPISGGESGTSLRLRYCPQGTIYPGRPNPDRNTSSLSLPPIALRGFYLGETEVTLAQFRTVMGESGMAAVKAEAARFQTSNPQLSSLIRTGKNEPVFFVGLPEAIQFCVALQSQIDKERAERGQSTIETRQVRLPSHIEWQYAARAVSDAKEQGNLPHFNRGIRFTDLTPATQEKCREVWAKLGRPEPFIGTQEQLLALTTAAGANEKSKVQEILAEFHHKLIGGPTRSSANGIGSAPWDHGHHPNDFPNAWNLFDIHDNVTEWVIWASSNDRREELWKSIASKAASKQSLIGQPSVFLAGGFFSDSVQNLAHFTIWGGPKIPEGKAAPQDFEYQADLVSEFSPGFRVLMDRTISEDWLLTLRRGIYHQDQWAATAEKLLDDSLRLLKELANENHPGFRTIEFYRVLMAINQNNQPSQSTSDFFVQLSKVKNNSSPQRKPSIAELLDESTSLKQGETNASANQDDSELFWKSLAALHSSHSRPGGR